MLTNLKAIRLQNGETQTQAAKKIGMSQAWYSLLEIGRYIPTDDMKAKLEKAFGKSAEYLLSEVELGSEKEGCNNGR